MFKKNIDPKAALEIERSFAQQQWVNFFDTALCALIDYGMRENDLAISVERAAHVADLALEQIEDRFPK